jgi:uncharacterized membrane protein YbhN (UPF0104 family)
VRWGLHGLLFAALAAGVFGLLPRIGGLAHDAAGLRHANLAFVVAAVVAQAVSLACYALLYRRVLTSFGARVRFWMVARVVLASFLVSHLTPLGSATGTLEAEGVTATTTSEAIGVTSGRPGRARLPARELLAPAAARRPRLYTPPAARAHAPGNALHGAVI